MKTLSNFFFFFLAAGLVLGSCRKKEIDPNDGEHTPTPYTFKTPQGFIPPNLPANNPLTEEGIEVGRHLFYDTGMSSDNTISCASCHMSNTGFTDSAQFSKGVGGAIGTRNSMPIFNLAWFKNYMWDGAAINLFNQVLIPWTSPIEMGVKVEDIPQILKRFEQDPDFVILYKKLLAPTKSSWKTS